VVTGNKSIFRTGTGSPGWLPGARWRAAAADDLPAELHSLGDRAELANHVVTIKGLNEPIEYTIYNVSSLDKISY
jgi:hypothetical protein